MNKYLIKMIILDNFVHNITNYLIRLVIIVIQIKPVTDLKDDYDSMEKTVLEQGQTVYLTKNGYGAVVMLSLENYSKLVDVPNAVLSDVDNTKKSSHIEIISKPKKLSSEEDD